MTDEKDKHFLRIVQDRLRMYSDLEPEDIAKLMLMARRGMKVKNPDRAEVLEEAARVIENNCHDDMTRAEEAAAIRALKEKT